MRNQLLAAIQTRYGAQTGFYSRATRGINATCATPLLSVAYLNMLTNGIRTPSLALANLLARHFQTDIATLFLGDDAEQSTPRSETNAQ